jgi:hypothetical protein
MKNNLIFTRPRGFVIRARVKDCKSHNYTHGSQTRAGGDEV